jgi:putative membrane protein
MPTVKGPSKAPGIILIVLGVLASFVAAPILFFVLWFQGAVDMKDAVLNGAVIANGSAVEVAGVGSYMIMISGGEATTCKMVDSGNNAYDMSPFQSDKSIYYIDGLNKGTYTVRCEGVDQKASMSGMSMSPNDFTNTVGNSFLWSTVVGVSGVVLLIVGIVLVVRAGSKRKELQQQAMMSAMY